MKKQTNKVSLLLTEGKSDTITYENALRSYIQEQSKKSNIKIKTIRGDLTLSHDFNNPKNVKNPIIEINKSIREAIKEKFLKETDIIGAALITDLDACFSDKSNFIQNDKVDEVIYDLNQNKIFYPNIDRLYQFRSEKRVNILRIFAMGNTKINKKEIPFRLFYNSIDLEHCFYNKINQSTEEKMELSEAFDDTYGVDFKKFVAFINALPSLSQDYYKTYEKGELERNAFSRLSNLSCLLEWIDELCLNQDEIS
ncbi:MAG: hypothetical protein IJ194_00030 [Bacilli bacterium]|nr:hypothetical protein [Bacilli bacterium]